MASSIQDGFAAAYPHISAWVREEEGWIEVGSDDYSASFVRASLRRRDGLGGRAELPEHGRGFPGMDAGIAAWLGKNRPWSVEQPQRQVRRDRGKKS